jgi:hypothetical protein
MQPEQYLDGQQDPMVEALRTAIRLSMLVNGNDRTKAAFDAVRRARLIGASDDQLSRAIETMGLRDD